MSSVNVSPALSSELTTADTRGRSEFSTAPLWWGFLVGCLTAAVPLALWWLTPTTVYSISVAMIGAIYIGFAVADGRTRVIAVEVVVATIFVVIAAVAVYGWPWVAVGGLMAHGAKDLWQHRTGFVMNARWWPPFCMVVDWVSAALIVALLLMGVDLNG
jgi:hypothetical protein